MPDQFLHGIEIIELNEISRPIQTLRSSIIGVIGTAPKASDTQFPYHTPVLISGNLLEAKALGVEGTLPAAVGDVFAQSGAFIVVVRVPSIDEDSPLADIAQLTNQIDPDTGHYQGCAAFLSSESELGVSPRILIAPQYSHHKQVADALNTVATSLRAIAILDGPNENDAAAISYRHLFSSPRLYLVDPWVKVWDNDKNQEIIRPASAHVAGLIARIDHEQGFWCSPSNQTLNNIAGLARSIDFSWGDPNARANLLNAQQVSTIIQKQGFRLWGNRSLSLDPKWAFLSVRRTADLINESLLKAHQWAVDRNLSQTYISELLEGVNAYLRHLKNQGAIINGKAWALPELNTPEVLADGKLYIDFDFTPPYPAEHISFRANLTHDYLTEVIA